MAPSDRANLAAQRPVPGALGRPAGQPVPAHRGVGRDPARRCGGRRARVGQLAVGGVLPRPVGHRPHRSSLGGHAITEDLRHWINDGLMTLFFFVIGLEIKQELTSGQLTTPRDAAVPAAGALGGMVVPAAAVPGVQPRRRRRRRVGHPDGHRRRLRARRARAARQPGAGRAEGHAPRPRHRRRRRRDHRDRRLLLRRHRTAAGSPRPPPGCSPSSSSAGPGSGTCPCTSCSGRGSGWRRSSPASTPPSPVSRSGCWPRPGRSSPRSTPTASPTSSPPTRPSPPPRCATSPSGSGSRSRSPNDCRTCCTPGRAT